MAYTQSVFLANSGGFSWQGTDNIILTKALTSFTCEREKSTTVTDYIAIGI